MHLKFDDNENVSTSMEFVLCLYLPACLYVFVSVFIHVCIWGFQVVMPEACL